MRKVNLFCLPFAGGNKYSYKEFERIVPAHINMISIEYPGRGCRYNESFSKDMGSLVVDAYTTVGQRIDEREYAIYGHSLGGIVAFHVAKKIIELGRKPPVHLFITGTGGPSLEREGRKNWSAMTKAVFWEEVRKLDGLPEEILKNEEISNYFEPILRADFCLSETDFYQWETALSLPITVINGTEEEATDEEILLWQRETNLKVDFIKLPGKHFFIFQQPERVIDIIRGKLNAYQNS